MEEKEILLQTQIKSGLEIHQQLDTHKLFCECPSILRNDEPEFEVRRKLHAVAGESGEIDVAAKHESAKDREFIYQGYDTTCLVELDEEPPHLINQEALGIALHIALLLKCEIIPISQIMRKTVIDGSNTSGFQRTVLIARDGYVETEHGKVGIENIYLEEDAARPASGDSSGNENAEKNKSFFSASKTLDRTQKVFDKNIKIYKLDRLGIPLVEIQTAPDISSSEQAKETALHIGDILRSCKVKRGIGTIRQDINISIPGHPRVEIKGFQEPRIMIQTVEKEIERQKENLKYGKKLSGEVRNVLEDGSTEFLRPMPGSARMYPETDLHLLKISKQIIDEAKRTLPKLRSDIKGELKKKGLSDEEIQILLKSAMLEEFTALLKIIDEPKFIFKSLIEIPKEVASHIGKSLDEIAEKLNLDVIESIIYAVKENKIQKGDVKYVMERIVEGVHINEALKIEKIDLSEIESEITEIVKAKPGLTLGGYMGLIMNQFKGKVSGKEVSEILGKLL